jgi:hypothetical protein
MYIVSTSCVLYSNSPPITPAFTNTIVISSTPTVTSTFTPTSTSIIKTEVPVSTSVELPIGDGGLLSGQPCESPCFFGVRLGETEFDQIIPILKTNGLSPCFKNLRSEDWMSVFCGIDKPRVTVDIREETLIVNGIGYLPGIPLSVGNIIAKYGEPNYVQALLTRDDSNNLLMTATLYWDTIAMEVDLSPTKDTGEHQYQIESTTSAESIYFQEAEDYMRFSREGSETWRGYDFYSKPLLLP